MLTTEGIESRTWEECYLELKETVRQGDQETDPERLDYLRALEHDLVRELVGA